MLPGKLGEDTSALVGALMILSWIINVAPTGGRVRAGGMKRVQPIEGNRGEGDNGRKTVVGYIICRTGCTILCSRIPR